MAPILDALRSDVYIRNLGAETAVEKKRVKPLFGSK